MSTILEWVLGASGWGVAGLLFYVYRHAAEGWTDGLRAANESRDLAMSQAAANKAAFDDLDDKASKEIKRISDANSKLYLLLDDDRKLLENLSAHDPAILAPVAVGVFAQLARVTAAGRLTAPKDGVHGDVSSSPSPIADDPTRPIINRLPLRANQAG